MLRRSNRFDRALKVTPFVKWLPKTTCYQNYFKSFIHDELNFVHFSGIAFYLEAKKRFFRKLNHMLFQSWAEIGAESGPSLYQWFGEPHNHASQHPDTRSSVKGMAIKKAEFCFPTSYRHSEYYKVFNYQFRWTQGKEHLWGTRSWGQTILN